jgi:hypothetical protein
MTANASDGFEPAPATALISMLTDKTGKAFDLDDLQNALGTDLSDARFKRVGVLEARPQSASCSKQCCTKPTVFGRPSGITQNVKKCIPKARSVPRQCMQCSRFQTC